MKAVYTLLILFVPFFVFTQNIISINPDNGVQGSNQLVEIQMNESLFDNQIETRLVLCDYYESSINNSINSYEFFNDNNQSTVFYQGQSIRLSMFNEIHDELKNYETNFEKLNNMFNEGIDFSISELNESGKQIGNKTAASYLANPSVKIQFDEWIFDFTNNVIPAVNAGVTASPGVSGQLFDAGGSLREFNSLGMEIRACFQNSLIGAFCIDQITNKYLFEIDQYDNIQELENYNSGTYMEHKFDEAYGYIFGLLDTPTVSNPISNTFLYDSDDQLLFKYLNKTDQSYEPGITNKVYEAFVKGRIAIENQNYFERDLQIRIINNALSRVIMYQSIKYLSNCIENYDQLNSEYPSDFLHSLSRAYGFILSLQFIKSNDQLIYTHEEINSMLSYLTSGNGFWEVSSNTLDSLKSNIEITLNNSILSDLTLLNCENNYFIISGSEITTSDNIISSYFPIQVNDPTGIYSLQVYSSISSSWSTLNDSFTIYSDSWECSDNGCVEDLENNYIFSSLIDCEANCSAVIENSWNCLNDACVDPLDGSGIFSSIDDCEANCSPIEPTWNCNDNFACIQHNDGSGNYQSLVECEANCNISEVTYDCISAGICMEIWDGIGEFSSIDECLTNCNPITESWNCVNDACIDPLDGSGLFSTLNDCEQECQNISSINENSIDVNIFPNPSSNIFNLEFNSDYETEILVTNILGEQVHFESIQSLGEYNALVDLSNYSKGVYNLTIKTSDGIINYKLILQ